MSVNRENTHHERVAYKSTRESDLHLDIFYPPGYPSGSSLPVILFCHGGAWRKGRPESFFPACRRYSALGFLSISVQYRLAGNKHATPLDCIADLKSAIRWIRQHEAHLRINPKKIAAAGFSAGAHLISCAAMINRYNDPEDDLNISASPDAVIAYSGALNNIIDPNFRGLFYDEIKIEHCSPFHNISSNLVPFLILHGTSDEIVPVSSIIEFTSNMKKSGNLCHLYLFEGKGHYFMEKQLADRERAYDITDKFLKLLNYFKNS